MTLNDDPVIKKLIAWGEARDDIRAVILTSTRAATGEPTDAFSDYDVIFVAREIRPYLDDGWLADFGEVLTVYRDPVEIRFGFERFIRVTNYENGLKIDFTLWPVGLLRHVVAMPELPDHIDDGYRVLLDRDGLTAGMKPFSGRAFVPDPPTVTEFYRFVERFFSNAFYAAKYIRRGDFFLLSGMMPCLRYERLSQLMDWKAQTGYGWSLKSGRYGRDLQKYLPPELLEELEATGAATGPEADWENLFRLIEFMRREATEVGRRLGYAYPAQLHARCLAYLEKVRNGELP